MADRYEVWEFGNGSIRVKMPEPFTPSTIQDAADKATLLALAQHIPEIKEEVRSALPSRTGTLSKAFGILDVLPYGPHRFAVRFYFDENIAPYWRYVLYGRNPDPGDRIHPKSAAALAFDWERMGGNPRTESGKWIFKSVAMSVVKPNRALQDTFRAAAAKATGRLPTDFISFLLR